MNHKFRQFKLVGRFVLVLILIFIVAGCDSGGGDAADANQPVQGSSDDAGLNPTGSNTGGTPGGNGAPANNESGFSETLKLNGSVQDIWTFESVSIIESDGTVREITDDIFRAYLPDAAEEVTVSDTATFREFVEMQPSIQSSTGGVRSHIDVIAGVLETAERQLLVMIATPDVAVGGLVDAADRLLFDITRLEDDIPAGEPLVLDYYFAVSTPAEEPDAATSGIELLTERLADGRFVIQTESPDEDSAPMLLSGNIGTTFEGSRGAGLPAKSQPLICGLPAKGGVCGPLCAGRALFDIYKGFEKSWTAVESNFGPGTGSSSPSPGSKCPPGATCANAGNDPHLRTFDGLSYSPQSVGEFTAIDYQSANTSIEMQWRFSPGINDRTVSFITAIALDIDGTRFIIDPNSDNPVSVNGQAVTFDDMGIPFVGAEAYDNANGVTLGAPRGSIYIATSQWSWLLSFSGRGYIPGQQWIKALVTAPIGQTDIRGMLGNADGKPIGDLISRDSLFVVPALSQASVADLYDRFVNTWRIADAESLFQYNANESTATFTDSSFPDFPNLIDGRDTLLSVATQTQASSADKGQAEAVCRLAGVSEQPGFDECVTDILTTGDFEIANDSVVMLGTDRLIKTSRFGTEIDGKDLQWWHVVDGSAVDQDGNLIGNDVVSLVTSSNADDVVALSAFDTQSGVKLWELDGVMPRCDAVFPTNDRLVVQMKSEGELVLIDAYSGTELDRYSAADALPECRESLMANSNSQIFHTALNVRTAFDIVDDSIALRWVNTNDADPMLAGMTNWGFDLVIADDLFIMGTQDYNDGGLASIYRIDSDTGLAINETASNLRVPEKVEAGGDDLIVVSGRDSDNVRWLEGFQIGSSPVVSAVWGRQLGATTADGVTSMSGRLAYNEDGFASWAAIDGGRGVARFSPTTGLVDWYAPTTSFDNNGQIVALTDGGFAVSPFGSENFVEAYSRDGSFAWSIPYPSGTDFPAGLQATGRDTIAIVSRNEGSSAASAFVSIGTRR